MASKLYPTLSAFYKAGNIGFGSEKDAILCGVPEEKLYRKPSKQRAEIHAKDASKENSRPYLPEQSQQPSLSAGINAENQRPSIEATPPEDDTDLLPLTPSAPPLLEMLDARLQQYLDVLLTTQTNPASSEAPPNTSAQSESDTSPQRATITLPLPPNVVVEDAWLDEIQPDYDDLTPEEMADEILNNLNVEREEDAKDHEKQKSLHDLRMSFNHGHHGETSRGEGQNKHIHHKQQSNEYGHRRSYQHQPSHNSTDDNEESDGHIYQYNHHHRNRHHNNAMGAMKVQKPQSREEPKDAGRIKRKVSVEGPPSAKHDVDDRTKRCESSHPHRRRHLSSHSRHAEQSRRDGDQAVSSPSDDRHGHSKSSPRGQASATEKENHNGASGRLGLYGENSDYNAWMTWRKQVNRQLATIILLKQQGREVSVQTADMRRKPLRQSSIDFVSQIATKSGSSTSLGGKPYVMYGIPRASLVQKNDTNDNKDY
ncbi:hypothetical protein PoB_002057500 [Plakobranchus ocellatus]|uniref:Uncharacterized protein n=1 Tax=Plakobranchus ocellatus TaxID=259542 RepID=A0AAV3ZEP1_9GAST|nr:hypothetical protein PoB_002057500 [Plakobranchus ocellatus]